MQKSNRSPDRVLLELIGRISAYTMLLVLIAAGMLWGAVVYDAVFYDEVGPVETLESVFAMASALIFLLLVSALEYRHAARMEVRREQEAAM